MAAPDKRALPSAQVQRVGPQTLSRPIRRSEHKRAERATIAVCGQLFCDEPRKDRRLSMNNQGAFDTALLHLLIQGHRSVSSSGHSQLRGPRGDKSAIGALIPDRLYGNSMEGKTIQQLLAAYNPEYLPLRRHLSDVGLPLLNALQDLHDRTDERLPSSFLEIVLAGGQRIARMFGLSMRMIQLWSAYQKLSGPRLPRRMTPVVLEGDAASREIVSTAQRQQVVDLTSC